MGEARFPQPCKDPSSPGEANSLVGRGQAAGSCTGLGSAKAREEAAKFLLISRGLALDWGTASSSCFLLLYKAPIKAPAAQAL